MDRLRLIQKLEQERDCLSLPLQIRWASLLGARRILAVKVLRVLLGVYGAGGVQRSKGLTRAGAVNIR
jgi:hypothetical protein